MIKSLGPQDIFKKVHLSERKTILRAVALERTVLLIKNENDETIYLTGFRINEDAKLFCAAAPSTKLSMKAEDVVVNFEMNGERYFFKTRLSFEGGIPVLNINTDMFQLQRRANTRLELPTDFPSMGSITAINGISCPYTEVRIKDISAGGCKVARQKAEPAIVIGDELKMILHLSHRRPFLLTTDVRFVSLVPKGQVLGVQFLEIDNISENRLLVLMMDLQREIHNKYGIGSAPE